MCNKRLASCEVEYLNSSSVFQFGFSSGVTVMCPLSRSALPGDLYILSLWLMSSVLLMVKLCKHCCNTMILDLLHILPRQDYYEYPQSFDQKPQRCTLYSSSINSLTLFFRDSGLTTSKFLPDISNHLAISSRLMLANFISTISSIST